MILNTKLQDMIDLLQEMIDEDVYDIEGFSMSLLVRDRDTGVGGYVLHYESTEFLKLIALSEIVKSRIIQDNALTESGAGLSSLADLSPDLEEDSSDEL